MSNGKEETHMHIVRPDAELSVHIILTADTRGTGPCAICTHAFLAMPVAFWLVWPREGERMPVCYSCGSLEAEGLRAELRRQADILRARANDLDSLAEDGILPATDEQRIFARVSAEGLAAGVDMDDDEVPF